MKKKLLYLLMIISSVFWTNCAKDDLTTPEQNNNSNNVAINISDIVPQQSFSPMMLKENNRGSDLWDFDYLYIYAYDKNMNATYSYYSLYITGNKCRLFLPPGEYQIVALLGNAATSYPHTPYKYEENLVPLLYLQESVYSPFGYSSYYDYSPVSRDDVQLYKGALTVPENIEEMNYSMKFKGGYFGSIRADYEVEVESEQYDKYDYNICYSIENIKNISMNWDTEEYTQEVPFPLKPQDCIIEAGRYIPETNYFLPYNYMNYLNAYDFILYPNQDMKLYFSIQNNKTKAVIANHVLATGADHIEVKKGVRTHITFHLKIKDSMPDSDNLTSQSEVSVERVDITEE